MKKEKWLLKEIDDWQQASLIDAETAEQLRARYPLKKNVSFMIVLFSIIGAVLIGTGVILIGARNWEYFPMPLRVGIAFLPLVVSQGFAVFTVKYKYESLAWRESIAILLTASVFAAVAIVGQIFHLPNDYAVYVLTCGLLSLPVIYILNAASPLLVYYWTVLNWAILESAPLNALILLGLFVLGAFFVFLKRNEASARPVYMTWVTVIAGFVLILFMGIMLEYSLLLVTLCFFVLLLAAGGLPQKLLVPFKIIGTLGGLVITAILTYESMWVRLLFRGSASSAGGAVLVAAMLAVILFFAFKLYRYDKQRLYLLTPLFLLCALRYMWQIIAYPLPPLPFMLISNLIMLSVGVGFIVYGVRNTALFQTNIGMATVCTLIIMRFFDSNMDFLWRGIVFLLLGTGFLLVNVRILRTRKMQKLSEKEESGVGESGEWKSGAGMSGGRESGAVECEPGADQTGEEESI